MINALTLVAGISALAGLIGIIAGPASKTAASRTFYLRLCQAGFTVSGLCLCLQGFLGQRSENFAYGFLLIVLGTGVTAFASRRKGGK